MISFHVLRLLLFVVRIQLFDPEVLKCSKYPYFLKTRIAGPNGHLSNNLAR